MKAAFIIKKFVLKISKNSKIEKEIWKTEYCPKMQKSKKSSKKEKNIRKEGQKWKPDGYK